MPRPDKKKKFHFHRELAGAPKKIIIKNNLAPAFCNRLKLSRTSIETSENSDHRKSD